MKRYSGALAVLGVGCICAVLGFAIGAYWQFLQTVEARQAEFTQTIMVARSVATNQTPQLMDHLRLDSPAQYRYLMTLERIRRKPLLARWATVAGLTWQLRATTQYAIRPSESLRRMASNCRCGIDLDDATASNGGAK